MLHKQRLLSRIVLNTIDAQWDFWNIWHTAHMIPVQMRDKCEVHIGWLHMHVLQVTAQRLLKGEFSQYFAKEKRLISRIEIDIRGHACIVLKCRLRVTYEYGTM